MNKKNKTIFIAATSAIKILIMSILTLISGRIILKYLGSDYNGLNSTINQVMTVITISEGGFSVVSVTALFKPLINNDTEEINKILTYSNRIFKKIGLIMFIISIIILLLYVPTVKTNIDVFTVYIMFVLSAISVIVKIGIVNKYILLINAEQKEYVINIIETIISTISKIVSIYLVIKTRNIIILRIVYLLESLTTYCIVILYSKNTYNYVSYRYISETIVTGTKDMFIENLVSVAYSSSTVLFLSSTTNTLYTSVYVVYNSIITYIKQIIFVVINAPSNAFGKLFAEKNKDDVYKIFSEYEFIVVVISSLLLSTSFSVSESFVRLYTVGINDINYSSKFLPIALSIMTFLELIHIPSGICIHMTRNFKASRTIQTITLCLLLVLDLVGALVYGFYGIIMGTIITTFILAVLEITYTRTKIFNKNLIQLLKYLLSNMTIFLIAYIESVFAINVIDSYLLFVIYGSFSLIINIILIIIINITVNKNITLKVFKRFFIGYNKQRN